MRAMMLAATLLTTLSSGAVTMPAESVALRPSALTNSVADDDLSVMSYNVKGLPWPIASGRTEALHEIGERLAQMRREGIQPHIVMLQEAFTENAKAIGAEGGYRYAAAGPSSGDAGQAATDPRAKAFEDQASFWKGETVGKWEDSGLRILSDYPIVASRRLVFPAAACAGYDCLANKGVLIAWIKLPGLSQPVAFADTHLNSGKASGVDLSRANAAFARQVTAAQQFIAANIAGNRTAFVAGDFNVGKSSVRQKLIFGSPILAGANETVERAVEGRAIALRDFKAATSLLNRHKDFLFSRIGRRANLSLSRISIPFGIEGDGAGLSDHVGYVTHFRIAPTQQRAG